MPQTWGFWQVLPQSWETTAGRKAAAMRGKRAPPTPTLHAGPWRCCSTCMYPSHLHTRGGTACGWSSLLHPSSLGVRTRLPESKCAGCPALGEQSQGLPRWSWKLTGTLLVRQTGQTLSPQTPLPCPPAPPSCPLPLWVFSIELFGFTNCSNALLTLWAAWGQKSTSSTPLLLLISKEKGAPKGKAKRKLGWKSANLVWKEMTTPPACGRGKEDSKNWQINANFM